MGDVSDLTPRDFDDFIRRDDTGAKMTFRAMFRRSLYLVSKIIVAWNEPRNLMSADTYLERQQWIQWVVTDHKRGHLEDPRSYIKSSGCTRSVPFFCLIQRPDEERDHPNEFARAITFLETRLHLRGPDSRLLICGDTESRAATFTGSVFNIFNTNPLFRWLFDEYYWPNPMRRAYKCEYGGRAWTPAGRRDPTLANNFLEAAGADSNITGGRIDGGIYNDLIGAHNYGSTNEVARQKDFVKLGPSLLENRDPRSPEGGFILNEGNRWSLNDLNSMIHDEFGDWAIWRRGVYRCYVHGLGNCGRWGSDAARTCQPTQESLWPARYPDAAALERLERDVGSAAHFAAQYLNDPTEAADLDPARMLPFVIEVRPVRDNRNRLVRAWSAVVPVDGGGEEVIPLSAMDQHLISVDPAASEEPDSARTAIIWYARDRITARRFVLDCVADRWAADSGLAERAIVTMVKEAREKCGRNPRIVIEKVAAQGYLASAVRHQGREMHVDVGDPLLIPPRRGMAKLDRARRKVGYIMSQSLLYVRQGLQLPRAEARHFPTGTLDTLDAIGQAEEVIGTYKGMAGDDTLAAARRSRREQRLATADRTGVGIG